MEFNRGDSGSSLQSEINITPLVDVVLVLLIIFMVVVPLLMQGYDVNIPQDFDQCHARAVSGIAADPDHLRHDLRHPQALGRRGASDGLSRDTGRSKDRCNRITRARGETSWAAGPRKSACCFWLPTTV